MNFQLRANSEAHCFYTYITEGQEMSEINSKTQLTTLNLQ